MKIYSLICLFLVMSIFCQADTPTNHYELKKVNQENYEDKLKFEEILEFFKNSPESGERFNGLTKSEAVQQWRKFFEEQGKTAENLFEHEAQPAVEVFVHTHKEKVEEWYNETKPTIEEFIHTHKSEAEEWYSEAKPAVETFIHTHKDKLGDWIEHEAKPAVEVFVHTHKERAEDWIENEAKPSLEQFVHSPFSETKPAMEDYSSHKNKAQVWLELEAKSTFEDINTQKDNVKGWFTNDAKPAVEDLINNNKKETENFFNVAQSNIEDFFSKFGEKTNHFFEKNIKPSQAHNNRGILFLADPKPEIVIERKDIADLLEEMKNYFKSSEDLKQFIKGIISGLSKDSTVETQCIQDLEKYKSEIIQTISDLNEAIGTSNFEKVYADWDKLIELSKVTENYCHLMDLIEDLLSLETLDGFLNLYYRVAINHVDIYSDIKNSYTDLKLGNFNQTGKDIGDIVKLALDFTVE
jgi:hypothetical protein